jgi:phosphomannomutase / phosphoglucomutase
MATIANPRVFREYDIRGVAERDLADDFALELGRAVGTLLLRAGARKMTLGRDVRLSSPRLHTGFTEGVLSTGLGVVDVGIVPTPVLYFATLHYEDVGGGCIITGSHNPAEDNGFKILRGKTTIHGADIQHLRQMIEKNDYISAAGGRGTVDPRDVVPAYRAYVKSTLRMGKRKPKLALDAGNGVGGIVAEPLYREDLGLDVTALYCEPDGRFPNHHPDPTQPENVADLIKIVQANGCEAGIALDGDADRIGLVDPRGRIVWGDQLMILFAREILKEQPGATFVSEVKCSQALYDEIARAGGRAIMWKVGHSLIKEKMKQEGAALAGEMSGHIFFANRYLGYDDAIYAGARLIELLSNSERTLEELVDTLPVMHNTPELRVEVPDSIKFELVARAVEHFRNKYPVVDVDGARIQFGDGWGLVRASNTQPALVMRFEASTPERVDELRREVEGTLATLRAELEKKG